MTSTESTPFRLTRRRALAGAAWSAPVIVVASAVPAFAALSPGSDLDLKRGTSAAVLTTDGSNNYFDLEFAGLSIVVPAAVARRSAGVDGDVHPDQPGRPVQHDRAGGAPGWSASPAPGNTAGVVTLTYTGAVAAGTELQVPSGIFIGADQPTTSQTGSYVVTATAPGLTSDSEVFATGPARPARGGPRPIPRPAVPR